MTDREIEAKIEAVRREVTMKMEAFERNKVSDPDERARAAIKHLVEQYAGMEAAYISLAARVGVLEDWKAETNMALDKMETDIVVLQGDVDGLQSEVAALKGRVTLCEGRIGRLEAKP